MAITQLGGRQVLDGTIKYSDLGLSATSAATTADNVLLVDASNNIRPRGFQQAIKDVNGLLLSNSTTNYIPKYSATANVLENSAISDNGTSVSVALPIYMGNAYMSNNLIATQSWVTSQNYITEAADNQSLTWTDATNTLAISGGNSVVLSGFADSSHAHAIGDVVNLQTTLDAKGDKTRSLYYVVAGGAAGAWTATISGIAALYEGLTIRVYMTYAGAATTTLDLNSLGAKTIYLYGSSKLTTHYPAGSVIDLTYSNNNSGCWYTYMYYYDAGDYQIRWQNNITFGALTHGYQVLMEGANGKFYPVTEGGVANSTTNVVSTAELRIGGKILYYSSATDRAADSNAGGYELYEGHYNGEMEYWSNRNNATPWATAYRPVYLVGTINANGNFVLDNSSTTAFLTQSLPVSDNGKLYIELGIMNNTSDAFRLNVDHPIYVYKNGMIRLYSGHASHSTLSDSVANGVYTTGSYADPAWITSLAKSKVGLSAVENTALSTWAGSANITTIGTLSSGTVPWARLSGIPSTFTPSSHTHGDINNDGTIASNTATPGSGDYLLLSDSSVSNALKRGVLIGTGTTTYLRNDGTWATPPDTNTTYSQATSAALGLVKLGSDTQQTVAANAVTATASRSYAVQLNASGQMLVNVPWVDTDTDTNTTYTFASGTTNGAFSVTPSGGGVQSVAIYGLGTAAYTASTAYATSGHTHNYAGSASAGGAANSVASSLTFNNGGAGAASGTTYNGSAAQTISYNSVGAAASSHTHDYLPLLGGTIINPVNTFEFTNINPWGCAVSYESYPGFFSATNFNYDGLSSTSIINSSGSSVLGAITHGGDGFIIDTEANVSISNSASQSALFTETAISLNRATTVSGDLTISSSYPRINLTDSDNNSDYSIINNNGSFGIWDNTNSQYRMFILSDGSTGIGTTTPGNLLHVYQSGTGFLTPMRVQNPGDPGTGATRLTVGNSVAEFFLQAYGSTAPGNLASAASLFVNTGSRLIMGAGTSKPVQLFSNNNYAAPQLTLAGNGNFVGINHVSPAYALQVGTDSAAKPSTNTWTISSDIRLKENVVEADLDRCYEIVKTVPLKRYTWKDSVYTNEQVSDRSKLGWIANDVQLVFPKAVNVHDQVLATTHIEQDESGADILVNDILEDCLDLNADQMYAAMYGAIQKLQAKVEALEAIINNQ